MIGYARQLVDYFNGTKPKKAQSVPASLFWKKEMGISYDENGNGQYSSLPFDLFIDERHSLNFRVGDHPLQDGTTVSDHVQREPREVTVEGMFTNHRLRRGFDDSGNANVVKFNIDGTTDVKPSLKNTALEKFNALKELALKKQPVRLVCSLDEYPKLVITKIDYDRDEKSGSSVRFTMTLREVNIVTLKSSTARYPFDPKKMETDNDKLIAQMKALGKTSAEAAEAAELLGLENVEVVNIPE